MKYADTNFFTRAYLQLPETHVAVDCIEALRDEEANLLPVTWLHRMEFVNALQLHVFASRHGGTVRVTPEQAAAAYAIFRSDLVASCVLETTQVPINDLERQVEELSLRHSSKHGFRTYDLLHVSTARLLNCDTFWSFDRNATKLAALEGLKVLKLPAN